MAKALVITEKPSVARDVADALGGFREQEGYYERDDMLVTFAVGHLYELLAQEDPDSAHSRYNALIRKLVSFERAAECVSR